MQAAALDQTLLALRETIAAIGVDGHIGALGGKNQEIVPLGHVGVDAALGGGLRRGTLHEVTSVGAPDAAAATGFALGLAARFGAAGRPWFWARQDMAALERGSLYGPGLAAFGLDPALLTLVAGTDAAGVLKAAEEGLRCKALAAVLIEPWDDPSVLDRAAGRRLVLAAEASGVAAILLRVGSACLAGAATRWSIGAAPSHAQTLNARIGAFKPKISVGGVGASLLAAGLGGPTLSVALARNRHGKTGRWIMEWKTDERCFAIPNPQSGLSTFTDRPAVAPYPAERTRSAG